MAATEETASAPNSRSMAARSSWSRSKTSFAVDVATVLTCGLQPAGRSARTVIRELHIDAEVAPLQQRDDFLQRIAVLAGDPDAVALDRGLNLLFGVFDDS